MHRENVHIARELEFKLVESEVDEVQGEVNRDQLWFVRR